MNGYHTKDIIENLRVNPIWEKIPYNDDNHSGSRNNLVINIRKRLAVPHINGAAIKAINPKDKHTFGTKVCRELLLI
jgi:hypothetical protein